MRNDDPTTDAIALLRPQLPSADRLLPLLREIDANRHYTNFGPMVRRLECGLADLLTVDGVVCTSSATSALELAIAALGLPEGSGIALPALNFPAAAHAILNTGHVPVICDVGEVTGLMSFEHVQAAQANHKVAAILPSSLNGCGYPVDYWDGVTSDCGLPVVLDAAGSIGYQLPGKTIVTVYSLHATKPLACAEGGAIVGGTPAFLTRVKRMSNFGFQDSQAVYRGSNAKMSEYHAAIGLASLEGWGDKKAGLTHLMADYRARLARFEPSVRVLNRSGICGTLTVSFEAGQRDRAEVALHAIGAETRKWYLPLLHRHDLFCGCARASDLSVAETLCDRLLGLPYGLHLETTQLESIEQAVGRAVL